MTRFFLGGRCCLALLVSLFLSRLGFLNGFRPFGHNHVGNNHWLQTQQGKITLLSSSSTDIDTYSYLDSVEQVCKSCMEQLRVSLLVYFYSPIFIHLLIRLLLLTTTLGTSRCHFRYCIGISCQHRSTQGQCLCRSLPRFLRQTLGVAIGPRGRRNVVVQWSQQGVLAH